VQQIEFSLLGISHLSKLHYISGIDADTLNSHYANVSTDTNYTPPSLKLTTVSDDQDYISEWSIFKALDTLRPTATGLDRIPAWFLRLGAAVFCKPLALNTFRVFHCVINSKVYLTHTMRHMSKQCIIRTRN